MLNRKFERAIRLFEKALDEKPTLHIARRNIGVCYELLGEYDKALQYYEEVIERDEFFSRSVYFRAGEASYKSGDYDKALTYFGKFEFLQGKKLHEFSDVADKEAEEELQMFERLDDMIRAVHISMDSVTFLGIDEVYNLGYNINSRADEYFPFVSNDQRTLFFTGRRNNRADENLYYSQFVNGEWLEGLPVSNKFNTNSHEGMCTIVRDGQTMFFTACEREGVKGPCDIWQADVTENMEIEAVTAIRGAVNSEKWESQAAISCDGSTLYFASDRDGGYGGTDIWKSTRLLDGSWSEPVNLGPNINTPSYEESPFITNDGQTLYFSSDGHTGLGDQDIYMSRLDVEGNWGTPVNLGPPINSAHRELCFFLCADGKTGYFASDRPDGFGGLDIYKVELTSELYSEAVTFVEGFVLDSILNEPIQTTVQFAGREPMKTDENGRFFICVPAFDMLDVSVEKEHYHDYQKEFVIPFWENKSFYTVELRMQPVRQPIREDLVARSPNIPDTTEVEVKKKPARRDYLHTVFFEFDEYLMSNSEIDNLDKFIKRIKDKNVQRVEIVGFSDDVGTDMYNLKLSEERAKQIALYLMDNGILVDQIYIEGRGEIKDDKPKNLNRKVEVKIQVLETDSE